MPSSFTKDPSAVLDYLIDWSDWLNDGETIVTSTWEVPTGITKDTDARTPTQTTIWLSGGTDGEEYRVTNHIVTSTGREDDRTLKFRVKHR